MDVFGLNLTENMYEAGRKPESVVTQTYIIKIEKKSLHMGFGGRIGKFLRAFALAALVRLHKNAMGSGVRPPCMNFLF